MGEALSATAEKLIRVNLHLLASLCVAVKMTLNCKIRMFHEINGKKGILERIKRDLDKLKILSATELE